MVAMALVPMVIMTTTISDQNMNISSLLHFFRDYTTDDYFLVDTPHSAAALYMMWISFANLDFMQLCHEIVNFDKIVHFSHIWDRILRKQSHILKSPPQRQVGVTWFQQYINFLCDHNKDRPFMQNVWLWVHFIFIVVAIAMITDALVTSGKPRSYCISLYA